MNMEPRSLDNQGQASQNNPWTAMIDCPHCKASSPPGSLSCAACGLVFSKWLKLHPGSSIPGAEALRERAREGLPCGPAAVPVSRHPDAPAPQTSIPDLGPLRRRHPADEAGQWWFFPLIMLLGFGCGGFMLLMSLSAVWGGDFAAGVVLLVLGALFTGGGAAGFRWRAKTKDDRLEIYERGVVAWEAGVSCALAWEEITAVYDERIRRVEWTGEHQENCVTLEGSGERKIVGGVFTSREGNLLLLQDALAACGPRHLAEARNALASGGQANFGPLKASREHLHFLGDFNKPLAIAWKEISHIQYENGTVYLHAKAGGEPVLLAACSNIANLAVFQKVLTEDLKVLLDAH